MTHKFAVGDHVRILPDKTNASVRAGVYTIVRVMPVTSEGCQYRAKNDSDSHERVLHEALLHPV